ncbi:hypothetical protein [Latilactobacillus graminis]|nr:hypothetical protein [Latilactobacillus graminis]QFP78957.1 hypothetical protein LG542_01325 [Latilactobacillus graminis]
MKDAPRHTVILGFVAMVIAFICGMLVLNPILKLNLWVSILISFFLGGYVGFNAFYSTYLTEMIKAEVAKQGLTSQNLAILMEGRAKDYPIVRGELRLIIPRRKRAQLLAKLRERVS